MSPFRSPRDMSRPETIPPRRSSSGSLLPIFLGMNTTVENFLLESAKKNSVRLIKCASREFYAELFHLYESHRHRGAEWLILHRSELFIGKLSDGRVWRVEILQLDDDGELLNLGTDWC